MAAGQAVCVAAGAYQAGSITVAAGGALDLQGGVVAGPIKATNAGVVRICGVNVTGSLTVTGSTGFVNVGGDTAAGPCAGNWITGPVQLKDNKAGVEASGNTVNGSFTVTGNTAPVHAVGNAVIGPVKIQ